MKASFFVLGLAALAPLAFAASPAIATPEPGTVILMASGLVGVGFAVWRRNRNK